MTTSRKTQSALRAALKKEDEAVAERLPVAAEAPAAAKPAAAAAKPAAAKPAAAKPAAAKPAAAKPAAAKPAAAKPAAAKPAAAKPAAGAALPPLPNTPPIPAPAAAGGTRGARPVEAAGPQKAVQDTFSMPRREHRRIKALRTALAGSGRPASKSDLLRVGLRLLEQCTERELAALLDALPPMDKGKRKKK